MRYFILFLVFAITPIIMLAQEKIDKPAWPHHGYENQMEAVPYYNEACELYQKGDTTGAINSLKEAINISFGLTEAQLFLALIYKDLGEHEKALIYFNSGIDFEVRQKSHFYFNLFYYGMRYGEYDMIKHNMKHFKKLFGTDPVVKYEEGYPYGMHDWEYIRESIELIYNFRNWQSEFLEIYSDSSEKTEYALEINGDFVFDQGSVYKTNWDKKKRIFKRKKSLKLPAGAINPSFTKNGNIVVFEKEENGNSNIYYAQKDGSKWTESKKLGSDVNTNGFDGQPYINKDGNCIYFVSDRKGSRDIYLVKVDFNQNIVGKPEELERVNSFKDEAYPRFNEDESIFYFSSNGLPGFGGYDVFWTVEYSMQNGVKYPMNPFNMNAGVNTKDDEMLATFNKNLFFLKRTTIEGMSTEHLFKRIPKVKMVEFELDMKKPDDAD